MTRHEKALADQLAQCQRELTAARQENLWLRQKIDLLVRRVFGASSERLDTAQLELLLQLPKSFVPEVPARVPEKLSLPSKRSPRDRTPRLPENLPVIEEVIEPEPVKVEPEQWRCIGQEVSEQLNYEPARFLRRRTIRKKYVPRFRLDATPVIAPLPTRLQDRSLPAPGLLAHILVAKYCDHLPLYRQEQIFARRHQVHLPRQTLARWVALAADWLQPIYEAIRTGVMAGGYVQVGQAIDYALGQWPTLTVYLGDGRVEIDNNLVENAICPTALGKKNWLFIGDAGAGQRSAIIYTIIESCRRRGLDPYAYLRDLLTRLPQMTNHQIPEVLPAVWGKPQRSWPVQTPS